MTEREELSKREKAEVRMELRVNNYKARMLLDEAGIMVDSRISALRMEQEG